MSRNVQTVGQLWREWTVGLTGQPAVQQLESTYGPRWRPQLKERTFFSRRKVIVDNIKKKAMSGRDVGQVIKELEKKCSEREWSLSRLSAAIKSHEVL
jgi:hypothetical protein